MRITQHTDYALRVLLHLGATGEQATIAGIAERHGISRNHLMKVVNRLIQEGYVRGTRGKGGGIRLARPAEAIRIGEVVRRIEGDFALVECFGASNDCRIAPACRLKSALHQALAAFLEVLDRYSLADFLADPSALLHYLAEPAPAGAITITLTEKHP